MCPKSTGQSTGSYKPWFISECKKAVKARQNAMGKRPYKSYIG